MLGCCIFACALRFIHESFSGCGISPIEEGTL